MKSYGLSSEAVNLNKKVRPDKNGTDFQLSFNSADCFSRDKLSICNFFLNASGFLMLFLLSVLHVLW